MNINLLKAEMSRLGVTGTFMNRPDYRGFARLLPDIQSLDTACEAVYGLKMGFICIGGGKIVFRYRSLFKVETIVLNKYDIQSVEFQVRYSVVTVVVVIDDVETKFTINSSYLLNGGVKHWSREFE